MMTKDEKIQAYSMWLNGNSFSEIGKHFGVSRQYIQTLWPGSGTRALHRETLNKYPAIKKWMFENDMVIADLSKEMQINKSTIYRSLKEGDFEHKFGAKFLKISGMTYNEAFAREE